MNYIRREIIRVTISFGIALFIVVGALFFLRSRINSAVLFSSQFLSQLELREANAKSLSVLHDQYEIVVSSYEEVLRNYVPRRDDLVNVSREIENEATRSATNAVVALIAELPPNPPSFGYVVYSVSVTGSLQNVAQFFENMRQFRFLNSREGFTFREQVGGVEASTRIRVYYQSY